MNFGQTCQEIVWATRRLCTHPARYCAELPYGKRTWVCGVHARAFTRVTPMQRPVSGIRISRKVLSTCYDALVEVRASSPDRTDLDRAISEVGRRLR